MALARKYYTINGEIISELRAGETDARDYVTDALGNVVAVFQNDWEISLATYDTSGEFLTNFNMGGNKFAWNGSHGYRSTGLEWSTHYVRARHYSFMDQAWTTVDPLWPREMPYGYVKGKTMSAIDPSGRKIDDGWLGKGTCSGYNFGTFCKELEDYAKKANYNELAKCMKTTDIEILKKLIKDMADLCGKSKNICIVCGPKPSNWPEECNYCTGEGKMVVKMRQPGQNDDGNLKEPIILTIGGKVGYACSGRIPAEQDCIDQLARIYGDRASKCDTVISICAPKSGQDNQWLLYHEMAHSAGYSHHISDTPGDRNDLAYRLECCLCRKMPIPRNPVTMEPGTRNCDMLCKGTGYGS